jgi:predicted GNAT superfamily acetyltransferase
MATTIDLRDIDAAVEPDVLALNNAHAAELSWLEAGELRRLVGEAYYARAAGACDAFMIGFDQDADYHSPNFLWFRERYPRFAYVDRVAVATSARGRGLARALYEDFFTRATTDGHTLIACEVNSDPPNPGSDAFHAALGFRIVGSAEIYGGKRTVRYYVREL